MSQRISIFIIACLISIPGIAQHDKTIRESYEEFKRKAFGEYESFRKKCNEEYAKFMRQAWKEFTMEEATPKPKEEPVPPVVLPIEEQDKPIESRPIPFDDVIPAPVIMPQPQPIEPIEVTPIPVQKPYSFSFFGTELQVSLTGEERFRLNACDDDTVADMWLVLADGRFDGLLSECLEIRKERNLCDWAYLLMLQKIADSFLGEGSNEAALLTSFLYCQSGYKMRVARQRERLCLLFSSKNYIYDLPSWTIEGVRYYPLGDIRGSIFICPASFPKEASLSLAIPDIPHIGENIIREADIDLETLPRGTGDSNNEPKPAPLLRYLSDLHDQR